MDGWVCVAGRLGWVGLGGTVRRGRGRRRRRRRAVSVGHPRRPPRKAKKAPGPPAVVADFFFPAEKKPGGGMESHQKTASAETDAVARGIRLALLNHPALVHCIIAKPHPFRLVGRGVVAWRPEINMRRQALLIDLCWSGALWQLAHTVIAVVARVPDPICLVDLSADTYACMRMWRVDVHVHAQGA